MNQEELDTAECWELVDEFKNQKELHQDTPKNLAVLLRAIGYNDPMRTIAGRNEDSATVMRFLEDNPDAVACLFEFIRENGDNNGWAEMLADSIDIDEDEDEDEDGIENDPDILGEDL